LLIVHFKRVCFFSRLHQPTLSSWNELVYKYTIILFVFFYYLIFVFPSL
jgi:hypothetical protein